MYSTVNYNIMFLSECSYYKGFHTGISKSDRMVNDTSSMCSLICLFEADKDTDDLVGLGEKTHRYTQLYVSLPHIDLVRSRMKAEHSSKQK